MNEFLDWFRDRMQDVCFADSVVIMIRQGRLDPGVFCFSYETLEVGYTDGLTGKTTWIEVEPTAPKPDDVLAQVYLEIQHKLDLTTAKEFKEDWADVDEHVANQEVRNWLREEMTVVATESQVRAMQRRPGSGLRIHWRALPEW